MSFKRYCLDLCTVALVAMTLASGCSGESDPLRRAAVNGVVTLDGELLPEGIVCFVPIAPTEGPRISVPIEQGEFTADDEHGPVVGKHRVEIQSTDDGGYAFDDEQAMQRLQQAGMQRIDVVRVPPAFNTNSTLTASVSADRPNEFTFNLTTTSGYNR